VAGAESDRGGEARELLARVRHALEQHPIPTLAIAFGAGLVLAQRGVPTLLALAFGPAARSAAASAAWRALAGATAGMAEPAARRRRARSSSAAR
jgi:hypothetical protein